MALRLTTTSAQSAGLSSAFAAPIASAASLGLEAARALGAGDLAGWQSALDQASGLQDPQRRYQAHVEILAQGLHAAGQAGTAVATRGFAAAADAALTILEASPSEPMLLNCAGIACYELWILDGAQALFAAARRLDPTLPNVARNLSEVARRKRVAGRRTRPLHSSAPGLARRAANVARAAHPATGLTLSLCMIVRNEEQMLPRCLAAIAPAVDEMVIVDTGSQDATIEIARSFGATVIEHPWTGSFSEARNISFEAATGDWLLYLDADEILVAQDAERLRELTGQTWREAFYLVETSYVGELGDGSAVTNNALRIFRNRPEYRFEGRLHEQIMQTLPTYAPGRVAQTAIRIQHYGYLGSVRTAKEKSQRNLELLHQQAAEGPPTPFLHFNLGSEYAAAGDPASAVAEFERALSMLTDAGELETCTFSPPLMVRLARVQRMCGRYAEAGATAARGLELFPELTDLVFSQAATALTLGDEREATRLYRRCMDLGDAPSQYGAMVGCGTFLPRMILAERHLARGETAPARELLAWCVEHHPDFLAVAGPYATALLRDGASPSEVLAELERLDVLSANVRTEIASALRRAGAAPAAEEQYRLAVAAAPSSARARTALAELLLARGQWDEAEAHAAVVTEDDAFGGVAARIELCCVIGRSEPDAVQAALERARRAGVPRAEENVFATWAAIAAGSPPADAIPTAGVPVLAVILQTLLGAGDVERFGALLPALRGSALPAREQHQLVGEMCLETGRLAQAAQEWMAVCAERPDARALLGLARVAVAHGMAADAVNFASGALELEPGSTAARELLARLGAPAPSRSTAG